MAPRVVFAVIATGAITSTWRQVVGVTWVRHCLNFAVAPFCPGCTAVIVFAMTSAVSCTAAVPAVIRSVTRRIRLIVVSPE